MRSVPLAALALLLAACGASQRPTPHTASDERARLVVVVVYDQVGSWALEEHWDRLSPEGALHRTARAGRRFTHVEYEYAATLTAPGHAAIHSGAMPWQSGVGSNRVWSRDRGARLSVMDDGVHPLLGRPDAFAGPGVLRVPTVGDVLRETSRGHSRVVSLGMKDRSAILPGGRRPDLCLWFDAHAGGFTTSTYYADALPEWLVSWRESHPWQARATSWEPLGAARWERELGPDERTGEGDYGWDARFPHDPSVHHEAFLASPGSTEHLLELARAAVLELELGADEHVDLLALSIASTDYVGHAFGGESWEYVDGLVRSDAALGAFLDELSQRTRVAVLLTPDHGAAPLVERSLERGHADAVRWSTEPSLVELRAHLDATLGPRSEGPWIEAWVQPYVVLPRALAGTPDHARVLDATLAWLRARPGIAYAIDVRSAAELRELEPIPRLPTPQPGVRGVASASIEIARDEAHELAMIGRSIPADPPGDILVIPAPYSVSQEDQALHSGTHHGSPWPYDTRAWVIASGPGVSAGTDDTALAQTRVAATIARLLGIDAPPGVPAEPLPGVD